MYLRLVVMLILWFSIPSLFAGEKPLPRKGLAAVIHTYADSIGCFVHIDPNNIVRYKLNQFGKEELAKAGVNQEPVSYSDREEVIALYDFDEDCTGGTAMSRPAFAVLRRDLSRNRTFKVIPQLSIPGATSGKFPQYIKSITVKDNQLWYSAHEMGPNDSLCCPSIPVSGRVIFKNGKWLDSSEDIKSVPN